tara:strand:+ start:431 stop:1141 length:711 start_codon:yes stop_codon:yes gene_type:complete
MKATIDEVISYSICPKLWSLKGGPLVPPSLNSELNSILTFTLRKLLESSELPSWKQLQSRWTKLYWSSRPIEDSQSSTTFIRSNIALKNFYGIVRAFSKSVLGINFKISSTLSRHNLSGTIPGIISLETGSVELIHITTCSNASDLIRDNRVKYLSAIMNSEIPVEKITSLFLTEKGVLKHSSLYPDDSFWVSSEKEMSSILNSMHNGAVYMNTNACSTCTVREECLRTTMTESLQ